MNHKSDQKTKTSLLPVCVLFQARVHFVIRHNLLDLSKYLRVLFFQNIFRLLVLWAVVSVGRAFSCHCHHKLISRCQHKAGHVQRRWHHRRVQVLKDKPQSLELPNLIVVFVDLLVPRTLKKVSSKFLVTYLDPIILPCSQTWTSQSAGWVKGH